MFNEIPKKKLTPVEALKQMCLDCECSMNANGRVCPFREITGEYCDTYETVLKGLKENESTMQGLSESAS